MLAEIQFSEFKVRKLSFESLEINERDADEKNVNFKRFNLKVGTLQNDPASFVIEFNLELTNIEWELSISTLGIFKRKDKDVDDAFLNSHFTLINAPAIVFPFVRAFVANYLANAGYPVVLLPAINFDKLHQEQISKEINRG